MSHRIFVDFCVAGDTMMDAGVAATADENPVDILSMKWIWQWQTDLMWQRQTAEICICRFRIGYALCGGGDTREGS